MVLISKTVYGLILASIALLLLLINMFSDRDLNSLAGKYSIALNTGALTWNLGVLLEVI